MNATTTKSPIRWKMQANGVPKMQGVYRMRDQEGFPLDIAYEIAKEKGGIVDWVEALTDAGRQSIDKYDALVEEIRMLEPHKVDAAVMIFTIGIMQCEGEFTERSQSLYDRMHKQEKENQ